MSRIAQHLSAEAQDHRPMPGEERGEGGLAGGVVAASDEPLK